MSEEDFLDPNFTLDMLPKSVKKFTMYEEGYITTLREQIAQEIEALERINDKPYGELVYLNQVLQAIRGK